MRDWCFRPDCLERFTEAWPHAEVHRLPDVGHWVVEDAPDESLAIIEKFLAVGNKTHNQSTGGTEKIRT
jgi:haloalkane dehalogenase